MPIGSVTERQEKSALAGRVSPSKSGSEFCFELLFKTRRKELTTSFPFTCTAFGIYEAREAGLHKDDRNTTASLVVSSHPRSSDSAA